MTERDAGGGGLEVGSAHDDNERTVGGMENAVQLAAAVNRYQERAVAGQFHPLTCGRDTCRPPERDERPLIARADGDRVVAECPLCGTWHQQLSGKLLDLVVSMADVEPWWGAARAERIGEASTATEGTVAP